MPSKIQHVSKEPNVRKRLIYFYCINMAMFALCLFLHGFFPFKSVRGSLSSVNDLPVQLGNHRFYTEESYKPRVDKLVIMLIDGIRYDFVHSEDGETNMLYSLSSINKNEACLFKLKASAPTVTMPRIKAITSGFVSNFVDVLMNFGSSEMLDDNVIDQANDNKYKILFYGDDTWLKLFPHQFHRSEGTTSFFVSDYTEVDSNVTRNVDIELEKDDWDIMILHYLGLDHIGHVDGPKSKLMKPKLNEMDDIVKKLHSYLLNQEKNGKSTLLMVMGDHGMADLGGHGGTSIPEIMIPLITFGLGCGGIHEHVIPQVNIASTLSILLGVPIPASNVGQVILPVITSSSSFSTPDILYVLYYNAYQVVTQFLQNGGTILHEGYKEYWTAQTKHTEWLKKRDEEAPNTSSAINNDENLSQEIITKYNHALHLMSSELLNLHADFHLIEMIVAMIIFAQLLLIALFGVTFEVPSSVRLGIVSSTVCSLTFVCWWMNLFNMSCCLSSFSSITFTSILMFIVTVNCLLISNQRISEIVFSVMEIKPDNLIRFLLLLGTVLQSWSLTSTSFIEKEEEVWYHLFIIVLISTMVFEISKEYELAYLRSVPFNNFLNESWPSIFRWCFLLLIHRVLKNYHRCQYHLTVHWLSSQNTKMYFSIVLSTGLIGVWWTLNEISSWSSVKNIKLAKICENFCTAACLIMVYYYRARSGKLVLPFTFGASSSSQGVFEVKIFFVFLVLLFLSKVYNIKKYSAVFNTKNSNLFPQYLVTSMIEVVLICWILLCTLLSRPYNVWLFCALFVSCKFFNERFNDDVINTTIIYYWMGMLFYFYQGNRNYISSIDITPGYVGQSDYNAVIAGLFIGINTFSFPVMAYFLLLFKILEGEWKLNIILVYKVRSVILLMNLLIYLFFTTTHRYHIFIWSVWSPKLLYVTANSIFIVILYWITEALLVIGGNEFNTQTFSSYSRI